MNYDVQIKCVDEFPEKGAEKFLFNIPTQRGAEAIARHASLATGVISCVVYTTRVVNASQNFENCTFVLGKRCGQSFGYHRIAKGE